MRYRLVIAILLLAAGPTCSHAQGTGQQGTRQQGTGQQETWQHFNGDLRAQKFSRLSQITGDRLFAHIERVRDCPLARDP